MDTGSHQQQWVAMGTNGAEVIMLIGNKCDLDRREVGLMHNFVWIYCQGKAIKGKKKRYKVVPQFVGYAVLPRVYKVTYN